MPELTKWIEVVDYSNGSALVGYVSKDMRFENDHRIHTSRIIHMAPDRTSAVTISGTTYQLGEEVKLDLGGRLPTVVEALEALPPRVR